MTTVRVGFAGGTTLLDQAIQKISGGDYVDITHAFIYLFGGIVEAEGVKEYADRYPGVWLHPADKYDGDEHAKTIEIDVPDIQTTRRKAMELIGTPYSYHGCLEAAAELAGLDLPADGELTVMCSEAVTRILRAGGLDACSGTESDMVTPVMLYEDLLQRGGKIV